MFDYSNEDIFVLADTLLSYTGSAKAVNLSSSSEQLQLHRIGSGAFYGNNTLQELTLPSSVGEIGEKALYNCPALRRVTLLSMQLPAEDFHTISAESIPCADGSVALLPAALDYGLLGQVFSACIDFSTVPSYQIVPECGALFRDDGTEFTRALYQKNSFLSFIGKPGPFSEDDMIWRKVRWTPTGPITASAEALNDQYTRKDKIRSIPTVAVATARLQRLGATVTAEFRVEIGSFFWPSLRHIRWQGDDYWVYRRCYLDFSQDYITRDMAIIGTRGVVTDQRKAEQIYAKYILPSLL